MRPGQIIRIWYLRDLENLQAQAGHITIKELSSLSKVSENTIIKIRGHTPVTQRKVYAVYNALSNFAAKNNIHLNVKIGVQAAQVRAVNLRSILPRGIETENIAARSKHFTIENISDAFDGKYMTQWFANQLAIGISEFGIQRSFIDKCFDIEDDFRRVDAIVDEKY